MGLKLIINRMFAIHGRDRAKEEPGPDIPTHQYTLRLNGSQLHAVLVAIQLDYVGLHKGIAGHPPGLNEAFDNRERRARDALGQVFEMIENSGLSTFTLAGFDAARAQVRDTEQQRRFKCGGN